MTSSPIPAARSQYLLDLLAQVPDPRKKRGRRHPLAGLLAVGIAAVIAGSKSFAAIGQWAADAGPEALAALGAARGPAEESTFRRAFTLVSPDVLDRVLGAWLHTRAVRAGGRLVIAIDGKAVRGAKNKDGKAPHLVAALAHGIGAVLGQVAVISGAGLFVISLIVLTILTSYIARFVQSSALSPIDRTLGLIFGVARGAVLVSLAYLVLDISLPLNDRPVWITQARSQPFLVQGADMLRSVLPEGLQAKSAAAADDAQRTLERATDAQKAMRALTSPAAPSPAKAGQEQAPAYKTGDRREMDRLIENTR